MSDIHSFTSDPKTVPLDKGGPLVLACVSVPFLGDGSFRWEKHLETLFVVTEPKFVLKTMIDKHI